MDIKIHRGLEQIGGCITEISTATSRVFIDMGQNLPGIGEPTTPEEDRQMVENIFAQNRKDHQAVFYTHTHEDHIGLFSLVPDDVPQFIGEGAKEIMIAKYESIIEAIKLVNKVNRFKLKNDDNPEKKSSEERAEPVAPNHNAILQRLKDFNTWNAPNPIQPHVPSRWAI
jgi:ribonuclease J